MFFESKRYKQLYHVSIKEVKPAAKPSKKENIPPDLEELQIDPEKVQKWVDNWVYLAERIWIPANAFPKIEFKLMQERVSGLVEEVIYDSKVFF